jgi:hypothetical protein
MRSLPKTAGANASPFARAGLTALLLLLPQLAEGQTVWDNGGLNNRWGTATNWSTNVVPGAGTNVQFNATDDNATVSNIELRADRSANSLTFNNVDDNFSIINGTGARILTLTSGDITRTAGSSGTQSLAMTTLKLSGVSVSVGTLSVTGNSTIDFTGVSTLNLTNFSISGGVTLNIINWAQASDFFYTSNWTGASYNTMGSAPMNQITFSGFTASESGWDSWDNQIRPRVPEPSTYGAMLVATLAGFFGWRRWRQARVAR